MARKRMIDPEFWSDEEIGEWSHSARLFYIALWNFADDEGRFKAHDSLLKSQIFPYDVKVKIQNLKKEMNGKIQWYEVDGLQYGFIRNFLKHQKIEKPTESKLPIPPPIGDDSGSIRGEVVPKRREEKLNEEKLREDNLYVDFEKSTTTTWNRFCDKHPTLSKILELSDKRRGSLKKRFEKESFRDFEAILKAIEEQPFLLNGNPDSKDHKTWKISFDWLIENDTNYLKVLEKKYANTGHGRIFRD